MSTYLYMYTVYICVYAYVGYMYVTYLYMKHFDVFLSLAKTDPRIRKPEQGDSVAVRPGT